jgi:hypothetical protein
MPFSVLYFRIVGKQEVIPLLPVSPSPRSFCDRFSQADSSTGMQGWDPTSPGKAPPNIASDADERCNFRLQTTTRLVGD